MHDPDFNSLCGRTPKLTPMATTEADKANAFIKVRRCIFSLLKRKLCEDVRYRPDAEKVTSVSGEQKGARLQRQDLNGFEERIYGKRLRMVQRCTVIMQRCERCYQTSLAICVTRRTLSHCWASLRLLPSSVEANPHCGLRQICSFAT